MELGVLVIDLGIAHPLSEHNRDGLLNGCQNTYAWRVYGKGTKPYWYPNMAHYKEPCIVSLHFPNLVIKENQPRMWDVREYELVVPVCPTLYIIGCP